jgi:putative transcriptional regulator
LPFEAKVNETNLAPGLLLAMPQLLDPNFARAAVLMIEHNDEGSFGLIVNQPSELSAGELLSSLDLEWHGDEAQVVWAGGPVMPTSGWVLHSPSDALGPAEPSFESGATIEIVPGLHLSTSPDSLAALAEEPPDRFRLLLGYSGWGPGQLASEMARGSWLHADVDPAIIFDSPAEKMWERALRTLGIDPDKIVQGIGIH